MLQKLSVLHIVSHLLTAVDDTFHAHLVLGCIARVSNFTARKATVLLGLRHFLSLQFLVVEPAIAFWFVWSPVDGIASNVNKFSSEEVAI